MYQSVLQIVTDRDRRKYVSRFDRDTNPMVLTDRDGCILRMLSDYRCLTTTQVTRLCFGCRSKAVARMRQLFDNDLVNRIFRPVVVGSPEIVYCLSRKGANVLISRKGINRAEINWSHDSGDAKPYFLDHVLKINDFRIEIQEAAKKNGVQSLYWENEKKLRTRVGNRIVSAKVIDPASKTEKQIPVTPDGYFFISTSQGKSHFFVEIDMATESIQMIKQKFRAYVMYLLEGHYAWQFSSLKFRVLTVTTNQNQLEKLIKTVPSALAVFRNNKFLRMFWFNTFEQIAKEGVFEGWIVPGTGKIAHRID